MTAEFADVSVGAAEGIEGWNTLIVAATRGAKLVEAARADGVLETAPLPDANLAHLKEASLLKKRRGLSEHRRDSGQQGGPALPEAEQRGREGRLLPELRHSRALRA